VIPLQPLGSRAPFFCVSIAPGPTLHTLARRLDAEQPFLGLTLHPSVAQQLPTPYTFEEIARHLAEAIRKLQPEGPYFLGGFCLNGTIAYETARALTAQGQQVDLLVLLEAVNPAFNRGFSKRTQCKSIVESLRFRSIRSHFARLWELRLTAAIPYLATRFHDFRRDARNLLWSSFVDLRLRILGSRLHELQQILYVAGKTYAPKPYEGRAELFRCTDRRAGPPGHVEGGWSGLIKNGLLNVHEIHGDHLGILEEPNLGVLAATFNRCLAEAQSLKACMHVTWPLTKAFSEPPDLE
jgi:thioesterase domain-containing protein